MRHETAKIRGVTYSASTIISKYQSNTTLSTKLRYAKDGHELLSALTPSKSLLSGGGRTLTANE